MKHFFAASNDARSRVLEDQTVKANKAIFTPQHLQRLWSDIDDWLCDVLIELMEKLDLSYKTPESPGKGLVVALLPSDEADYRTRSRGHRTDGQLPLTCAAARPSYDARRRCLFALLVETGVVRVGLSSATPETPQARSHIEQPAQVAGSDSELSAPRMASAYAGHRI